MITSRVLLLLNVWLARFADHLLGPIARAGQLLLDDDALLVHTPRAIEDFAQRR